MIQDVLRSIGGVGLYGAISVLIFFTFFSAVLIWALRLNKSYLDSMCELPLEQDEDREPAQKGNHDHE